MLRLVLFLVAVAALASGLAWLAERPGSLLISWQGYEIETSVFRAIVLLALLIGLTMMAWSIVREIWRAPANVGLFFNRRRHRRGLEALSGGMIAIGAGDRQGALRHAVQARRALPNEPLTHLLRAQAAQLSGDRATSRRIFEAMLGAPETELLGLRGLFLEAEREGEREAARQFAERAMKINPTLGWPVEALFDLQCKTADWSGALKTLAVARKHGHIEKPVAARRRAVLLTALAQAAEDTDPNRALALAQEAHGLAEDLVPAAAIAGRLLAARGNTAKAAKIIQRTWKRSPHPDLATVYAYARLGDSPRDRLTRIRQLTAINPYALESAVALAQAAIEAREFDVARSALAPLLDGRLTQRVATLMARIEGEEHGDKGRVREWLARAVNAPRDPAWTADGIVADKWAPVSPVTGALDAFQWRVPVEQAEKADQETIAAKLEELVALGARREPALPAAASSTAEAAPHAPSSDTGRDEPRRATGRGPTADVEDIEPAMASAQPLPSGRAAARPEATASAVTASPPATSAPAAPRATPVSAAPVTTGKGTVGQAEAQAQAAPRASGADRDRDPPSVAASPPREPAATVQAKPAPAPAAVAAAASAKTHDGARTRFDGDRLEVTAPPPRAPAATVELHPAARKSDPRLFMPPRAPDDPGIESDEELGEIARRPASAKGTA